MAYRIGIFDPAFMKQGHFISYDRYVAELVDIPEYQLVFLDLHGEMSQAYALTLKLSNQPEFRRLIPERAGRSWQTLFGSRLGSIADRLSMWRQAFRSIKAANLDLVLITSEAYDPFMYLFTARFPYFVFILNARLYVYRPQEARTWKSYAQFQLYSRLYRRFLAGARGLVSGSEPAMKADLERKLGFGTLPWLPNLSIAPTMPRKEPFAYDFLTIGTISRSKNHLFGLEAFEKLALPHRYLVAGLPRDAVGQEVEERVKLLENRMDLSVRGEFGYIDDQRYDELMRASRFAFFPYDRVRGNISSQVMHDCFRLGVPILAPDIEPFRWYVEKYGVGILYAEGDIESLADAMHHAMETPPASFADGFARLAEDHSFERIQAGFLPLINKAVAR